MECEVCGQIGARLEHITGDTDVRLCARHKRALRRELRNYKDLWARAQVIVRRLRSARLPSATGLEDEDVESLHREFIEKLDVIDAVVEEWLETELAREQADR